MNYASSNRLESWLDVAVNFEFRGWLERDRDDREVRMYIEMGVFG